eukprot:gene3490-3728_t
MSLRKEDIIVAYWTPRLGIGSDPVADSVKPGPQIVEIPVTEVLKYLRSDGSSQITVLVLTGAYFTQRSLTEDFLPPYITLDSTLHAVLSDSRHIIDALHDAGIKVIVGINGARGGYHGWQSIPRNKINDFVHYLKSEILDKYNLDGIDIGEDFDIGYHDASVLIETVKYMKQIFSPDTILSKLLDEEIGFISEIVNDLTFAYILMYGDDFKGLEEDYKLCRQLGFQNSQLLIGVNVGDPQLSNSFTSLNMTKSLTAWQPEDGRKAGMMIWTFSQDIQQFTACPQNEMSSLHPNENDHSYQRAIIEVMESQGGNRNRLRPRSNTIVDILDA